MMDAMAWLWAGALSLVAFVMGWRMGIDAAARAFARNLEKYQLLDLYIRRSNASTPDQERHP